MGSKALPALAALTIAAGFAYWQLWPQDEPPQAERKVIFVQGIGSWADCDSEKADGFGELWIELRSRTSSLNLDENQDLYLFSYSDSYCDPETQHRASYQRDDTCSSIDEIGGHSYRFGQWFEVIRKDTPRPEFDIIAHSMGGVVVLYWLSEYATPKQQDQVHSIVTLDSPLQGRPIYERLRKVSPTCRNGPALDDLQPGSETINGLNSPLRSGDCGSTENVANVAARAKILTVRNHFDLIVPYSRACVAGAVDHPLHCLSVPWNHNCIITNTGVQKRLADWIEQ